MDSPGRILLALCLAILCACSRETTDKAPQGVAGVATVSDYPYNLSLGSSYYRVEQEPEQARLTMEFVQWSDNPSGGLDAVFRVTNPGDRAALVWNVRQQFRLPSSDGVAAVWETQRSEYPGRGWRNPTIPAGGSEEFPMPSETENDWRVCLLYSREMAGSQATNRLFDGTFESISPTVRDVD